MYRRFILPMIAILLCLYAIGCSGAMENPAQPGTAIQERAGDEDGRIIWGVYTFAFNPDEGDVFVLPNRELAMHFDVTAFVTPPNCYDCVQIVGSNYQPALQQWTITVQLKNPAQFAGYDVRGLVRNLGPKWLKIADGCMDKYLAEGMNFKAFAKLDPARKFWPMTTAQESYVFHYPPGAGWAMIDYIVDASWPGNCKEPCIENISFPFEIEKGPVDSPLTVTGFDHQGEFFAIQADLSPIGGDPFTVLFDDGQHGDGDADDGIFGVNNITATAAAGTYRIKLTAFDSGMHYGSNCFSVEITGSVTNEDPVIDEITMSRKTCLKGSNSEKVELECIAHDPDFDILSYHWSADAGSFNDADAPVTFWTPPDNVGKFPITCEVSDGLGGEAAGQSEPVRVTQFPIIPPAPVPNLEIEYLMNFNTFQLYDYVHQDVVVTNFFST